MFDTEYTLEEGRIALSQLEKQLQIEHTEQGNRHQYSSNNQYGSNNSVGSRKQLYHERKLLDQKPRDARLNFRKGSPLGLTLEVTHSDIYREMALNKSHHIKK
jgi:hypothetical protein